MLQAASRFLCAILPHGAAIPAWAVYNATVVVSQHPSPWHFFDWAAGFECQWLYYVYEDTYVDLEALRSHLDCLYDPEDGQVLGTLADGSDRRPGFSFPFRNGRLLPVAKLAAGLAVSRGAAMTFGQAVADTCMPDRIQDYRQQVARSVVEKRGLGVTLGPGSLDVAAAICMHYAGAPFMDPLGHGREQFVLGKAAAERTALRRFVGPAAQHLPGSRPCVIAAFPVSREEQRWLSDGARNGLCRAAGAVHFSVPEQMPRGMVGFGGENPNCPALGDKRLSPTPLEARGFPPATQLTLLAGLPGGATTWFYDALREGLANRTFAHHSGYFHPFCNDLYRVELSHFAGAAEDYSFSHIFRERVPPELFDRLAERMVLHALRDSSALGPGAAFLTRENVNVWRMPDFARAGFRLVALYRHRKHTFPLSDAIDAPPSWEPNAGGSGDVVLQWQSLCRSCFYFAMHVAAGTQPEGIFETSVEIARSVALLSTTSEQKQVTIHVLFWYVMLLQARKHGYAFPIVRYDLLVEASPKQVREHLSEVLPPGLSGGRVASALLRSRKDAAWLAAREARYYERFGEAELLVQKMLKAIARFDPHTDLSLLM